MPGDVRSHEPALSTSVRGAMFVRGDHWVDNQRLVVAYAQAAVDGRRRADDRRCGVARGGGDAHARALWSTASRTSGCRAARGWRLDRGARGVVRRAPARGARRNGQMVALNHVPPILTHAIHAPDVYVIPRLSESS
jgi:glycine/D-amino acid oxidase-like deaminating enzyme